MSAFAVNSASAAILALLSVDFYDYLRSYESKKQNRNNKVAQLNDMLIVEC